MAMVNLYRAAFGDDDPRVQDFYGNLLAIYISLSLSLTMPAIFRCTDIMLFGRGRTKSSIVGASSKEGFNYRSGGHPIWS